MKNQKGITLIALVITIIVLLILAAVSITALTDDEKGVVTRAKQAAQETEDASDEEDSDIQGAMDYLESEDWGDTTNDTTGDTTETETPIVLDHSNIIPEGGVYYVGISYAYPDVGYYTGATATYTAGDAFPETVNTGDTYVYGEYEYRYNFFFNFSEISWEEDENLNGWGVKTLDTTKTTYTSMLETINNKPITCLEGTFSRCSSLVTFAEGFTIPDTVIDMCAIFYDASSLVGLPDSFEIPTTGTVDIDYAFDGCSSLESVNFIIPSNVLNNMWCTFSGCTSLGGTIVCDVDIYSDTCFSGTTKTITVVTSDGSSSYTVNG